MESTLFIEISEITARVLLYNNIDQTTHHIDITGGYGKRSIPLHIHYLEDGEILIGEDTFLYAEEQGCRYYESILSSSESILADYIYVLKSKVVDLIPNLQLSYVLIISNNQQLMTQRFLDVYKAVDKDTLLKTITYVDAISAWSYKYLNSLNTKMMNNIYIAYMDFKYINFYQITRRLDSNLIIVKEDQEKFDLDSLNQFYLQELESFHKDLGYSVSSHQISQLYHNQKATIHKQQINKKDVNIYSSLIFPPQKFLLKSEKYIAFKDTWINSFRESDGISFLEDILSVDHVFISGAYDSLNFAKGGLDDYFDNYKYEENLLLEGGFEFLKLRNSHETFLYKEKFCLTIGVFNNKVFYPLISEDREFKKMNKIDLLLTDYQKEIILYSQVDNEIKPVYTFEIQEPMKIQRIILMIKFNENKEIDEVSYELRRL